MAILRFWPSLQGLVLAASLVWAAAASADGRRVLLELYTSQGCYSCPPAEELLAERYLERDDVLALEMHVDYWDDLVYRGSLWRDPYSSPAFTMRQRRYAMDVFTPQMIIQGAYSASGTSRRGIDHAIAQAQDVPPPEVAVSMRARPEGGWTVRAGDDRTERRAALEVLSVVYLRAAVTSIDGGENKNKTLRNHNIVIDLDAHGLLDGDEMRFALPAPPPGHGCAVIVQQAGQGPVLGAWTCPPGTG